MFSILLLLMFIMSRFGMLLLFMLIVSMFGKCCACDFHYYYDYICQCHTSVKAINIANVMLLFLILSFTLVSLVSFMHLFMLSLLIWCIAPLCYHTLVFYLMFMIFISYVVIMNKLVLWCYHLY